MLMLLLLLMMMIFRMDQVWRVGDGFLFYMELRRV